MRKLILRGEKMSSQEAGQEELQGSMANRVDSPDGLILKEKISFPEQAMIMAEQMARLFSSYAPLSETFKDELVVELISNFRIQAIDYVKSEIPPQIIANRLHTDNLLSIEKQDGNNKDEIIKINLSVFLNPGISSESLLGVVTTVSDWVIDNSEFKFCTVTPKCEYDTSGGRRITLFFSIDRLNPESGLKINFVADNRCILEYQNGLISLKKQKRSLAKGMNLSAESLGAINESDVAIFNKYLNKFVSEWSDQNPGKEFTSDDFSVFLQKYRDELGLEINLTPEQKIAQTQKMSEYINTFKIYLEAMEGTDLQMSQENIDEIARQITLQNTLNPN